MSADEKVKEKERQDSYQQVLIKELKIVQTRAEKFEDMVLGGGDPEQMAFARQQAEKYSTEATKVRNELIMMNRAVAEVLTRGN